MLTARRRDLSSLSTGLFYLINYQNAGENDNNDDDDYGVDEYSGNDDDDVDDDIGDCIALCLWAKS